MPVYRAEDHRQIFEQYGNRQRTPNRSRTPTRTKTPSRKSVTPRSSNRGSTALNKSIISVTPVVKPEEKTVQQEALAEWERNYRNQYYLESESMDIPNELLASTNKSLNKSNKSHNLEILKSIPKLMNS